MCPLKTVMRNDNILLRKENGGDVLRMLKNEKIDTLRQYAGESAVSFKTLGKWILISTLIGLIVGAVGAGFALDFFRFDKGIEYLITHLSVVNPFTGISQCRHQHG